MTFTMAMANLVAIVVPVGHMLEHMTSLLVVQRATTAERNWSLHKTADRAELEYGRLS
jgi:hypothetical protein